MNYVSQGARNAIQLCTPKLNIQWRLWKNRSNWNNFRVVSF